MTSFSYNQGEQHFLAAYFQNEPPTFGPFFVGLGGGGAYMREGASLVDLNEISGNGYQRQMVTRDSSPTGWELRDGYVQSPELAFINTSAVNCWEPVDFVFLTLSAEASNSPDVLIAAVELPNTIDLGTRRTMKVIFRFKQTTTPLDEPRHHEGISSLTSYGLFAADAVVL